MAKNVLIGHLAESSLLRFSNTDVYQLFDTSTILYEGMTDPGQDYEKVLNAYSSVQSTDGFII